MTLGEVRVGSERHPGPQWVPTKIADHFVTHVCAIVEAQVLLVARRHRPLRVPWIPHQMSVIVLVDIPSGVQQYLRIFIETDSLILRGKLRRK